MNVEIYFFGLYIGLRLIISISFRQSPCLCYGWKFRHSYFANSLLQ